MLINFIFIFIRCLMDAKNIYLMLSKTKEHEEKEEAPTFGRQKNNNVGIKSGLKYENLIYKVSRKASMALNGTEAK
jgi:hypothetical protein